MTKKVSDVRIEKALRRHYGLCSQSAKDLGITRQSVHQRIQRSAYLQAVVREIRESVLDDCEIKTFESAAKGDSQDRRYLLDRLGKARGYATKTENSFDEAQLEALVSSLGGDPAKFRAALVSLGVDPDQG